jgi:hypothetical protein
LRIVCRPAAVFSLEWALRFSEPPDDEKERFLLIALGGMLDVLAAGAVPVLGMRLIVTQLDTHPVRSTEAAFNLAGRDVARQILLQTGQLEPDIDVIGPYPVSLGAAANIVQ